VQLDTAKGKAIALATGSKSEIGDTLYVLPEGGSKAEVTEGGMLAEKLDKPLDELVASLREKDLVKAESDQSSR